MNSLKKLWQFILSCVTAMWILSSCGSAAPDAPDSGENDEPISNLVSTLKSKVWTTSSKDYSWSVGDNIYFDEDKYHSRMYFFDGGYGVCLNRQITHEYIEGELVVNRDIEWFEYTEESSSTIAIIPLNYKLSRTKLKLEGGNLKDFDSGEIVWEGENLIPEDKTFLSYYGPANGKCGEDVTYRYEPWKETLRILGKGEMQNYTNASQQPWRKFRAVVDVDIDGEISHIGDYAFSEMSGLMYVKNSSQSIVSYGDHCFEKCVELKSLPLLNKVQIIGNSAFRDCKNYSNIISEDELSSLVSIADNAFLGVKETSLRSVKMSSGLTSIGSAAFGENKGSSVTLNEGLKSISNITESGGVFTLGLYGSKIKLELPSTVETIGLHSFSGDISEIHIGPNVKSIGSCAFATSQSTGDIYVESITPPACADNIVASIKEWTSLHAKWTLHVPDGCEVAYKEASGWNKFKITGGQQPADPDDADNQNYWASHKNRGPVSSSWKGSGTSSDPYLIESAADLRLLSDKVRTRKTFANKHFLQTADIVVNHKVINSTGDLTASASALEQWVPIGVYRTKYQSFQGYYDGGGHAISGVYIDRDMSAAGLFGFAGGGRISNIVLKDSYIKSNGAVGGIVGYNCKLNDSDGSYLRECTNYATVIGPCVGGIIGRAQDKQVVRCINYGKIVGLGDNVRCGGIAGDKLRANTKVYGEMSRCINYGVVEAKSEGLYGGIVGYGTRINDCLHAGKITGTASIVVGGIAGTFNGTQFSTGCNNNVVTGEISCPNAKMAGIIVGRFSSNGNSNMAQFRYNRMLKIGDLPIFGLDDSSVKRYDNLIVSNSEMKSSEMVKTLNANSTLSGTPWKIGDDGYPCPAW